jgi:hypothetical protein
LAALWAAANAVSGFDPLTGLGLHARHGALAARVRAPDHQVRALIGPMWDVVGRGADPTGIEARLKGLGPLAEGADLEALVRGARGFGSYVACEVAAARPELTAALAHARAQGGLGWVERFCETNLALCDNFGGQPTRLIADVDRQLVAASARGDRLARLGLELTVGYQVELYASGDVEKARRRAEAAMEDWGGPLPPDHGLRWIFADANLKLTAGDLTGSRDALRRITWLQRPLMRYRVIRSLVWLTEARCRVAAGAGASDSRLLALCARLDAEGAPTCTAWAAGLRVAAAGADASPTARAAAQSAFLAEGHVLLAAALDGPAALNALGVPRPEVVARGTLGMT